MCLKVNLEVDFGTINGGDDIIQERERVIISLSNVLFSVVHKNAKLTRQLGNKDDQVDQRQFL